VRSLWSPDGELILFKAPAKRPAQQPQDDQPHGSDLKQLTHYPAPKARFSGSFSPDGKWITFSRFTGHGIFVMRAD
jgi:Tol biopolymer transport system component